MTATMKGRITNAYLIGEIIGMLGFGFIIDRFGRKVGVIGCTALLILGIIITVAAHGANDTDMLWMLVVGRGIGGVGAGGECPVCGTGSTEAADEADHVRKNRGFLVGLSTEFAIDMSGIIVGIVVMIVLLGYHKENSGGVWRVSFGLGMILPLLVFYFRLKMISSTQYRKHAMRKNIPYWLVVKRYWRPMIGTAGTWFMYDFVVYPFGLFSTTIISQLNPDGNLFQDVAWSTVTGLFSIPAVILGAFLMDKIGRKNAMMLGFFSQATMGFILGGALRQIQTELALFLVLYGIFGSLSEIGPGVGVSEKIIATSAAFLVHLC
jgi:MFS family permease